MYDANHLIRQLRESSLGREEEVFARLPGGGFWLSRNPSYLGLAGLHRARALAQHSTGMLVMWVPVIWVIQQHVIAAEETFHAQQFGEQWQAYRKKVRRWL